MRCASPAFVRRVLLAIVSLSCVAAACGSAGHGAETFYRGKQIRLIAGFPVGNDYDVGARLLVKYLPKYIPGAPAVIVQNMPQAASVAAVNYLYAQAPRDGTVFGSFSRNIVNDALTGEPNVRVDPRRLIWLGATSHPTRVCVRRSDAPVKTPARLRPTHERFGSAPAAPSSPAIDPTGVEQGAARQVRLVEVL